MSKAAMKKQTASETPTEPALSATPGEQTALYKRYAQDVMMIKKKTESAGRRKMTVKEMADLLGLKKTESYWLVHKHVFETTEIGGKMWVDIASFEKWYANQIKYRKVTGEEPGKELKEWSYSPRDLSELLGISESAVYEMIKNKQIETVTVDHWMRIPKDSFQTWYESQDHYQTADDRKKDKALRGASISLPQMAGLLGLHREQIYQILRCKKYAGCFEVVKLAGRPRVTKESFTAFLAAQDEYKLVSPIQVNTSRSDQSQEQKNQSEKTSHENDSRNNPAGSDSGKAERKDYPPESETEQISDTQDLEYLTLVEAAAIADISRQALTKYASRGCFGCQKHGRILRINRKELEEWLLTR